MRLIIVLSLVSLVLSAPKKNNDLERVSRDLGVSGGLGQRLISPSSNFGGFENSLNFQDQELLSPQLTNFNVGDGFTNQGFNVPEVSLGAHGSVGIGNQGFVSPNEISLGFGNQGFVVPERDSEDSLNALGHQGFDPRGQLREFEDNLRSFENQDFDFQGHLGGFEGSLGLVGNQGLIGHGTGLGGQTNLAIGGNQGYVVPGISTGGLSSNFIDDNQRYVSPESIFSQNLGIGVNQEAVSSNLGAGNLGFDTSVSNNLRGSFGIGQQGHHSRGGILGQGISSELSQSAYGPPHRVSNEIVYPVEQRPSKPVSPYGRQCGPNKVLHVDGTCVIPHVSRNVFIYRSPKLPKPYLPRPHVPKPKVLYNLVFVRTPESAQAPDPIVVPPPQQKTVVYVLTKNGQVGQKVIEVPAGPDQDPEVFYVNYNDGDNPVLPGGITLQEALSTAISHDGQLLDGYSPPSNIRTSAERTYGPPRVGDLHGSQHSNIGQSFSGRVGGGLI